MPSLSIVIPVYNAEASLPRLLQELAETLPRLAPDFEVVLVNDGSRDGSWKVIEALARQYPFVHGIELMRNYGQHNAVLAGVRAARMEVIVTMDDDLQHPPSEIKALLDGLGNGADVVYGVPLKQQHGIMRDLASYATKLALKGAMGADTARSISAFRAFRTTLRGAFTNYQGPFVSVDVLLTWATTRFSAVKVRHDERRLGTSNYTFRKLITHAFNMMTGFSILPLQIVTAVGLASTAFGVLLLGIVLYNYFILGGRVPGFTFLVSAVSIFSGAQLFSLGIIGEYLGRAHFRLMDKPPYAVRTSIAAAEGKQAAGELAPNGGRVATHK
jgi:glycosyltransferase involved in cell wall biosynthesis